MKPVITLSEEVMLAYLSSWGPLGTEISFNIKDAAADLGYNDKRYLYILVYRLRSLGLAEIVKGKRRRGETTFICHARPEDCIVDDRERRGWPRGKAREPRKVERAPRVVMRFPKGNIPYAGFDRYAGGAVR